MGLLKKLKSALGLGDSRSPAGTAGPDDVEVTVEREPSTESEDAVKGTDTAASEESSAEAEASEVSAAESEAGSEPEAESGAEPESEAEPAAESPPVTELNGIGPAYGERLNEAGIETVADLAAADPEALAAETDLGQNRVAGWVDQAEQF